VCAQLSACAEFELIYPGFVSSYDAADEAGRSFRDAQIDLLVINETTYIMDFITVHVKRLVDEVPVLMLALQFGGATIPDDISYPTMLADCGLLGHAQLCGAFAKAGWTYDVIVGLADDPTVYRRVAEHAKLVGLVKRLKTLKIGAYGHPFRGMYDLEYDKTKLQGRIGPETIYIEDRNLKAMIDAVREEEVETVAAEIVRAYRIDDIAPRTVRQGARIYIAFKRLAEEYRLDVISLLSQYTLQLIADDTGGYAASRLLQEGLMISCEGDVSALTLMFILNQLSGVSPYYGEYEMLDVQKNAVIFMHHGDGDPRLARRPEDVRITKCPEVWGCEEAMALEFIMRPGPVTLAALIDDAQGFKMLIAGGQALEHAPYRVQSPHVLFQPRVPILDFFQRVLESGFPHHGVVCPGDYTAPLQKLAKLLGVRTVVIQ
jgi:L-arabinose isomerase